MYTRLHYSNLHFGHLRFPLAFLGKNSKSLKKMTLPVRLNQQSTFLTLYHLSDHVFCTCSMLHDTVHTQEENAGLDIVLPMLKRIRKTKVLDIYKDCDLFNTWTTFCSPFGYNTKPYTGIV